MHLVQSRTDEAIVWLEKARSAIPAHPNARATLASAYALKGDTQRAAAELAEAKRLVGDDRYSSIAHSHIRPAEERAQVRESATAQIPGAKISVCHGVGGMFAASGTIIIMSNDGP